VLSKHGEFSFFFPQNMVTLCIVLIKKSFVGFALPFFFVAKWEHLAQKRYPGWGSGKQQPTLQNFNFKHTTDLKNVSRNKKKRGRI
jgi:hypothetical protein